MSNQNNPQYGINPFQRYKIQLGPNIDRSNGQYFPEVEGTGFYIERADYPVLLSFNSQGGGIDQSMSARDGGQAKTQFKGLTVTHPILDVLCEISIIVFKGDAEFTNQLDSPVARLLAPTRTVTNTPALQVMGMYIYPGVRAVKNLQAICQAATVTFSTASFYDKNGAVISSPKVISQNFAGANVVYNGTNSVAYATNIYISGGVAVVQYPLMYIPSQAVELQVAIQGTVLSQIGAFGNYE
jgi:hypothetical protein